MGRVHGGLSKVGKVKGQTDLVELVNKKRKVTGRAKKRLQYNRRVINGIVGNPQSLRTIN